MGTTKYLTINLTQLPKAWNKDNLISVLSFGKNVLPGSVWIADNDYTATHNAMYYISIWGADVTGEIKANMPTGVNNPGLEGVHVYPNPTTNGNLFISLNEPTSNDIILSIFDVNGKLLRNTKVASNNQVIKLDVSTFENGVYFLKIVVENRIHNCKFIVQK